MLKPFAIPLALLLAMASGCDTGQRISRLEKQNADLRAAVEKNNAAADYDLQARCSRDARAWFSENWARDKTTILLTYTNHYHKPSNKCFIFVEFHFSMEPSGSWINDMSLWDVYENSEYGHFSETHYIYSRPKVAPETMVGSCEMLGKKCKTIDEFNELVRPYLNN